MLSGDQHGTIQHHFWRMKYTELNEIFAFMSLRSFALSLVAIFIPIYLYRGGYSFRDVIIFYCLLYSSELLFEYFTAVMIKKIGPKHLIAISVPFLILHLFQLLSLSKIDWPIWSIALSGGLALALYWQSYHYDFSRSKHRRKTSGEVGKMYIILTVMGATAPLLGGLLASLAGMEVLFGVVIAILLLATLILFKTSENNFRPGKLNLKKIKIAKISKDLIAYGGNNIEVATVGSLWPLFLYLIVSGYEKVGAIIAISALLSVIITYYVSNRSDRGERARYVKIGGFFNGAVGVCKVFATTIPRAFGISILKSLASSVQASPFVSEYYLHADEESRSEYIYLMESANDISKTLFFVMLLSLTYYFSDNEVLIIGLILGGFGALLTMIMPPARCEICGPIINKKIKVTPRIKNQ